MNPYSLIVDFDPKNITHLAAVKGVTDFQDPLITASTVLNVLQDNPGSAVRVYFHLYSSVDVPADNPTDTVVITYTAHPSEDSLCIMLHSEEGLLLHHGYFFRICPPSRKISLSALHPENVEKAASEGTKIVMEYGQHIDSGVRWAAYLLYLYSEGGLQNYFENEQYLEIH